MSVRGAASVLVAAVALLAWVIVAPPALADGWGGHGGGGRGGGNGGGAVHATPSAHFGGGNVGGGRFAGGGQFTAPARPGGFAAPPHFAAPRAPSSFTRQSFAPHIGVPAVRGNYAPHGFATTPAPVGHPAFSGRDGFAGRGNSGGVIVGRADGRFAPRFRGDDRRDWDRGDHDRRDWDHDGDRDGHHWHGRWDGGYWRGYYWPPVFWGPSFAWFLPTLPAYAPAYWWDGVPYYYYDNAYYVWDSSQDGYVATAPPPVATDSVDNGAVAASPDTYPDNQQPPADSEQVYAYPANGQSPEQQAQDRQACEQWAASQAASNSEDPAAYRRAIVACLTGRGYSVD